MNKKVIVTVTNDLYTDQRVDKLCRFLVKNNIEVLLVGRFRTNSLPLQKRNYDTHRLKLFFDKGAFFYIEYNIRLFFFLLFKRFDFLVSNDLDTLLACDLAASSKGKKVIYDSHEYFTEVPELQNRKWIKKIWETIEIMCLRNIENAYTVNKSIAKIYSDKYNIPFRVIRNLPESSKMESVKSKSDLDLPNDKFILILQGAGINVQRGAEELLDAMKLLEDAFLIIVGSGDVFPLLKEQIQLNPILQNRVKIVDKLPYAEMMQYTLNSDLGLTLDKDTNPNYRYSLPNKIFDYIKAGIPILSSRLPEIEKVILQYEIGTFIPNHQPEIMAQSIKEMIRDKTKYLQMKENTKKAFVELSWENQEETLKEIYKDFIG